MSSGLIDGILWWSGLLVWCGIAILVLLILREIGWELCKSARMTFIYFRHAKLFVLDRYIFHRAWRFISFTYQGAVCNNMEISWTDEQGNRRWVKWKA